MKNSGRFLLFYLTFAATNFRGTYSSIEMLKGYMVRERSGTPAITQLFLLWGVGTAHVSQLRSCLWLIACCCGGGH